MHYSKIIFAFALTELFYFEREQVIVHSFGKIFQRKNFVEPCLQTYFGVLGNRRLNRRFLRIKSDFAADFFAKIRRFAVNRTTQSQAAVRNINGRKNIVLILLEFEIEFVNSLKLFALRNMLFNMLF